VIFLTGGAGMIGRSLLASLVGMPSRAEVIALEHKQPIAAAPGIRVLAGDISRDTRLGLAPADVDSIAPFVTTIIHGAAATRFDEPISDALGTNARGTRNVLEFARRCPRLERVVALSTAHVAGKRKGIIFEDDLEHDAGFVNTYEASKYEAERELRAAMRDLPVAVARISTVSGDSCTGIVPKPTALHQAVRLMYAGLAPMVPGAEDSPVDLVALDHVARTIVLLATDGFKAGETWHVCAGADAVPLGELLDATLLTFAEHRPAWRKRTIERPAIVDLPTFELFCKTVEQAGDATLRAATAAISRFAPQLAFPKRFDDRRCQAALARAGITRPESRLVWVRTVKRLIQPSTVDLESRILEFVRARLLAESQIRVDEDTYLFDAGLVDSLKILQLIAFVEQEIGRSIPDTDVVMRNFRSVRTMARHFGS
jgi:nucleoside-diphosphate-sugar epimerase/acyl carrier protein